MVGVGLLAMTMLVGCRGSVPTITETRAWHGQTPVMGSYQFGRLTTDLPPGTPDRIGDGRRAGDAASTGHIIESYTLSPQGGHMVALAGGGVVPYDRIKINTSYEGSTVVLVINLDPGDENRSRVVLESLLEDLNM